MHGDKTHIHIKKFLRDYPDGYLYVVVGYASVWGLAWLQENTARRPVTLVIGDTKPFRFEKATDSDRRKALALLRRRDVEVLNWYRTARSSQGASMLHAKSWVVTDQESKAALAALIGSANLTKEGLQNNWEMMAVVSERELPRIWAQLDGFLTGKSGNKPPWDAAERVIGAIENGKEARQQPTAQPAHRTPKPAGRPRPSPSELHREKYRRPKPTPAPRKTTAKKKGGCLSLAAVLGAVTAAIITTSLLLLF